MKNKVFAAVFLLLLVFVIPAAYCSQEIDATAVVVEVISGDTFQTQSLGLIKLADVDPACADVDNSTGYFSAKSFLASLVGNNTVFLDIDALYITDQFGTGNRTVALVYVDFNSTHYRNVNFLMLNQKQLAVNDQENQFNPNTWTSFVNKNDIPEFSGGVWVFVFAVFICCFVLRNKLQLGLTKS